VVNRQAIAGGIGAAVAVAAFIAAVDRFADGGGDGFVGLGPRISDINLVLEVVLVLGLTFGMRLARAGNVEAHRRHQTMWVLVNLALVVMIMIPSLVRGGGGSLSDFSHVYAWVTWLHAALGTLALASGLWLVLQMNDVLPQRYHVAWWKTLMRITLAAYWGVALLGLATYIVWYRV
jgi:uncharacterized membrane protein YozB (DUF420 family)